MVTAEYKRKHFLAKRKGDVMFKFFKGKEKGNVLYAPCKGKVVPLTEVNNLGANEPLVRCA